MLAAIGVLVATLAGASLFIYRVLTPDTTRNLQLYTVVLRSFPITLEEKGELRAANSIEIRSELEGTATIINLVEEGTRVKKGDLLVELASDVIEEHIRDQEIAEATAAAAYEAAQKELEILRDENASKIRKAELALQLAELALEKYREGEAVQLRQEASLAVDKARSVLERAKADYKDSQELFKEGFITRIELEDDRFAEYAARLELTKAELALEVLEKYTIPMALQEAESAVVEARKELERERKAAAASEAKSLADVNGKKAQLEVIREKLAKYRDQKSKARITAPADGLVVYARGRSWYRSEDQIEKGTQVHERQSLIELPDTSTMKVVIRVHEAQVQHLKVGLPATVELEGYAGRRFTGRVSRIGVLADSQNRWLNPDLKEYETEILLDGDFSKENLKPGTTARARIELAHLNNVIAVPVQAVFAKNSRHYVFVDKGDKVEVVPVRIGLASAEYVEIKSGLEVGQVVRLAVTDEMKLMLPELEGMENPEESTDRPPAAAGSTSERSRTRSRQSQEPADAKPAAPAGSSDGAAASRPARSRRNR